MNSVKTVSSREFLHSFGELSAKLRPGESITVTKHGKPVGTFTRQPKPVRMPDFVGNMRRMGLTGEAARKLTEAIRREL